jgi:glycosyltransferase involved in cell wall biosynthesis
MSKLDGISFMVRVRNEEKTLEESIRSLFSITIPHEIVIILHLCNDKSEEIAERLSKENSNIKIFKYNNKISKPGYELLATDADSIHSLIYYYNWCLKLTKYHWVFKWDADFISTSGLIDFLNNNTWEEKNMKYHIRCINSTDKHIEPYLVSGLLKYTKYLFWEVGFYNYGNVDVKLGDNISIIHNSELTNLKEYWKEIPWYKTEVSDEASIVNDRIKKLTDDFGVEKEGMARCCNTESIPSNLAIMKKNPSYINIYE